MSVNPDALTTLEHLKTALGITTASSDDYLNDLINQASYEIDNRTFRKSDSGKYGLKARRYNGASASAPNNFHTTTLVPDEDYVFFSGSTLDKGGNTITNPDTGLGEYHLPAYPVHANSVLTFALAVLSSRGSSGGQVWDTTSYVELDDYVVDRERGILRLLTGPFVPGVLNYRITMAAGYQYGSNAPYVPPDLEKLCIEVCKKLWNDDEGITQERLGTWGRTFDPEKSQRLIDRGIDRYTRHSLRGFPAPPRRRSRSITCPRQARRSTRPRPT